jgi:hypothetical protein
VWHWSSTSVGINLLQSIRADEDVKFSQSIAFNINFANNNFFAMLQVAPFSGYGITNGQLSSLNGNVMLLSSMHLITYKGFSISLG